MSTSDDLPRDERCLEKRLRGSDYYPEDYAIFQRNVKINRPESVAGLKGETGWRKSRVPWNWSWKEHGI